MKSFQIKLSAWLILFLLSLMNVNFNLLLPNLILIRDSLACSNFEIQLSLVAGPALAIPVNILMCIYSERFSRKNLIIFCITSFLIGSLLCALSTSISQFLLGRSMQIIGDSGLSIIALVVLSDLLGDIKIFLGYNAILIALTSIISPLIGNWISSHYSWQLNFYILTIMSTILLISLSSILPRNSNKNTDKNFYTVSTILQELKSLLLIPSYKYIMFLAAFCSCIASVSDAYSPFFYIELSDFSETTFAYIRVLSLMVGISISLLYIFLAKKHDPERILQWGCIVFLIYSILVYSAFLTNTHNIPIVFFILGLIQIVGNSLVNPTALTITLSYSKNVKGISPTIFALTRNVISSIVLFITSLFFTNNIDPIIIAILLTLIVVVFSTYRINAIFSKSY